MAKKKDRTYGKILGWVLAGTLVLLGAIYHASVEEIANDFVAWFVGPSLRVKVDKVIRASSTSPKDIAILEFSANWHPVRINPLDATVAIGLCEAGPSGLTIRIDTPSGGGPAELKFESTRDYVLQIQQLKLERFSSVKVEVPFQAVHNLSHQIRPDYAGIRLIGNPDQVRLEGDARKSSTTCN